MKKQTAANNPFLKEVKVTYNVIIFKKISKIVNEKGTAAGKQALKEMEKEW